MVLLLALILAGAPIQATAPKNHSRHSRDVKASTDNRELSKMYDEDQAEDFLLAHEFCVVALALGDKRAAWLAAASEDRFLMNISRPQRFGTQFRPEGPQREMKLYRTDGAVSDSLRARLSVPTLAEAKAREAQMNSSRQNTLKSSDAGR